MSQHDYIIENGSGAALRSDLNACLAAIGTTNKGSSRPPAINAGMLWLDDNTPSSNVWTLNLYDGTDDIALAAIDTVNNAIVLPSGVVAGVGTSGDAAAGRVGEFVSSSVATTSAVGLSNTIAADVTSLSLTAGDWDVSGVVGFSGSSSTVQYLRASIGAASATINDDEKVAKDATTLTSTNIGMALPGTRFSLATTTTIHLVALSIFASGTVAAFGRLSARRAR